MKKSFKALTGSLFVLALVTGVSSCGGNSNGNSVSGGGKSSVVKIMFHVDSKSEEGMAYKKRIDAFNQAYADQGIRASASYVARTTGASAYETDLMNKQVEGTLPDIITYDAPNCASYAKSGLLYDITDLVPEEVKNDFVSTNEYQGKLYGLPIQESSAGFYYNKNLFAEAGIDVSSYTVENPWTFDQFKEVCRLLKEKGNVKYPVDMRLDATKDETATYLLYSFIYAAGGDFISEDGYTATGYFDSEKTADGFRFIKDLITAEYTSYSIGATDFFDGSVGMYLSSGWTIPDLDNKYPTTFPNRDSWGLLPYPKGVTVASATGSWCFGVTNNGTRDKSAAKELLLWLTSTESSKAITDATGMIPARKSVENSYEENSPEYVLMHQLQLSGRSRPNTVGYPKFTTCFNQIISELKDGDIASILTTKTQSLQSELDKLKNQG